MTALAWPRIRDVESKTLSAVALELCLWCVAQGICEVGGANRGPWVDEYNRAVGLDPAGAYPWCTSGMYCCFREAARQKRVVNPFPKTAKAVSVYTLADPVCRISNPVPGAVGVLSHGRAWASEMGGRRRLTDNGHVVIASGFDGPALTACASANTNAAGSREGNRWANKTIPDGGGPETVHGGTLLCWFNFDLAPTRAAG